MLNKLFIFSVTINFVFMPVAFAATDYTLLAPLPGGSETIPAGSEGFALYAAQLFTFLLSAAAILALVMLVVGGLQYMGSAGNPQMISDAKGRITNALLGLLLAVAAWLILFTINPALISLRFVVEDIATSPPGCAGLSEDICGRTSGCTWESTPSGPWECTYTGSPIGDETFIPPPLRLSPSSDSGTDGLPPPPPPPPPPPNL